MVDGAFGGFIELWGNLAGFGRNGIVFFGPELFSDMLSAPLKLK
jgi:hypothetical protein